MALLFFWQFLVELASVIHINVRNKKSAKMFREAMSQDMLLESSGKNFGEMGYIGPKIREACSKI